MGTGLTRASYRTGSDIIGPVYSDIVLSFAKNPVTGTLGQLYNESAVAQMLQCLIMTQVGSWPFEFNNGSRITSSMFAPNDAITTSNLSDSITEALSQYAPMVALVSLQVGQSPVNPDYALLVTIFFRIQNIQATFSTAVTVDRRIR